MDAIVGDLDQSSKYSLFDILSAGSISRITLNFDQSCKFSSGYSRSNFKSKKSPRNRMQIALYIDKSLPANLLRQKLSQIFVVISYRFEVALYKNVNFREH